MVKIENNYWVDILNDEYWVEVYIGNDENKLKKLLRGHFDDKNFKGITDFNVRGRIYCRDGFAPFILVCVNLCKTKKQVYATLAHEAVHVIDEIFNTINDNNRGELFAHSVSAIMKGCNLEEKNKKKG